MEDINNEKKNNKLWLYILAGVLVVSLSIWGIYTYNENNKLKNIEARHEDVYILEYPDDFDTDLITLLYTEYFENVSIEEISEEDYLTATISKEDNVESKEQDKQETPDDTADSNNEETDEDTEKDLSEGKEVYTKYFKLSVEKTISYIKLIQRDTQAPVFEGETEYTITLGDSFDLLEHVAMVDPVDGKVELTFSDYDLDSVGTHPITITGKDKHGNETVQEVTVTVNEKVVTSTPPSSNSYSAGNSNNGGGTSGSGNGGGSASNPCGEGIPWPNPALEHWSCWGGMCEYRDACGISTNDDGLIIGDYYEGYGQGW